jgi:hypothetical protein
MPASKGWPLRGAPYIYVIEDSVVLTFGDGLDLQAGITDTAQWAAYQLIMMIHFTGDPYNTLINNHFVTTVLLDLKGRIPRWNQPINWSFCHNIHK